MAFKRDQLRSLGMLSISLIVAVSVISLLLLLTVAPKLAFQAKITLWARSSTKRECSSQHRLYTTGVKMSKGVVATIFPTLGAYCRRYPEPPRVEIVATDKATRLFFCTRITLRSDRFANEEAQMKWRTDRQLMRVNSKKGGMFLCRNMSACAVRK